VPIATFPPIGAINIWPPQSVSVPLWVPITALPPNPVPITSRLDALSLPPKSAAIHPVESEGSLPVLKELKEETLLDLKTAEPVLNRFERIFPLTSRLSDGDAVAIPTFPLDGNVFCADKLREQKMIDNIK